MVTTLSYLVTCHNETDTLERLLDRLYQQAKQEGDEIILLDDFSDNPKTLEIINNFKVWDRFHYYKHSLDHNYGAHKNEFGKYATGNFLFQIDGDELPSQVLLMNIKDIIEANPSTELFLVPRVNDFRGVTSEIAKRWGWRLENRTFFRPTENKIVTSPCVNPPDYQSRIYKNIPERIKWDRRLHEKIEGYTKYSLLPDQVDLSLYHDKTIETQMQTNMRYNKEFSEDDNKGHIGYK